MKNKRMKIARIEKDLSQEQLAEKVGVTRQTIGMIEAGKFNPSLQLCIAICRALDRTLDGLFWEDEERAGNIQSRAYVLLDHLLAFVDQYYLSEKYQRDAL